MPVSAVIRPGNQGMVTDVPMNLVSKDAVVYAQDVILTRGTTEQRRGWAYSCAVPFNSAPIGCYRARYPYLDRSNTAVVLWDSPNWAIHELVEDTNQDGPLATGESEAPPVPQCSYHGETIFCHRDGKTPIKRYSGTNVPTFKSNTNLTYTQGEATVKLTGTYPEKGSYCLARIGGQAINASNAPEGPSYHVHTHLRVAKKNTDSVTLEDVVWDVDKRQGNAQYASGEQTFHAVADQAWPGQIEEWVGTVSCSGGQTVTGHGTDWGKFVGRVGLALYVEIPKTIDGTEYRYWCMVGIKSVANDTSLTLVESASYPTFTKAKYKLCSTPTWTCATEHKNSLFGSGSHSAQSRVWISPPAWNPGLPPDAVVPEDISTVLQYDSGYKYTLDYIDVGGEDENEPVHALLSSPGPCLALKRGSVYGIFGQYPNFEVQLLSDSTGCIHPASAITVGGIPFWADRNGVYWYHENNVQQITQGITNEWRGLLSGWVEGTSSVTLGVVSGHLVVSVQGLDSRLTGRARTGRDTENPSERTYLYEVSAQRWVSRVSNMKPYFYQSARIPGEPDACFFTLPDSGYIADFAPAITGVKTISRDPLAQAAADYYDANTKLGDREWPQLQLLTSSSFTGDFVGETRVIDLEVTGETDDQQALVIQELSEGGLRTAEPATLYTQQVQDRDGLSRHFARVGRSGRQHQVYLGRRPVENTGEFNIHEVSVNFRRSRKRS